MNMKYKVALLGATGAVGQRFIELLRSHPWFEIGVLAASERSTGKKYKDACNWILESEMPEEIGEMTVVNTDVAAVEKAGNINLIFSSLPPAIADRVEELFSQSYPLFSKASSHRMVKDVPLIIPEINPEHTELIKIQKENRKTEGFITTDPNCSTIQMALTLKPLIRFGLTRVAVTTMQALSGAGYPGVSSLDILDNVIPYIPKEEEKLENEILKLFGTLKNNEIKKADITVSASCNRVHVKDGHMENIIVDLEQKPEIREIKEAMRSFEGEPQRLKLPSAPAHPVIVREEKNRPQPRYDRNAGKGMSAVVGRLREDKILTAKYMCLGHNTIRGAAGSTLLQAELFKAKKLI
jgi:aspartate-semialdehyde dehydrogenase